MDSESLQEPETESRFAMHLAAQIGDVMAVGDLILKFKSTRLRDREGRTPLLVALHWRKKAVAEFLVDVDGTNQLQDMLGATPLHYAALLGYDSIVAKMLLYGSHSHIKDENGEYAIHYALKRKNYDIVSMILAINRWRRLKIDWPKMKLPQEEMQRCISIDRECRHELRRIWDIDPRYVLAIYYIMDARDVSELAQYLQKEGLSEIVLGDDFTSVVGGFPHFAALINCMVRVYRQSKDEE